MEEREEPSAEALEAYRAIARRRRAEMRERARGGSSNRGDRIVSRHGLQAVVKAGERLSDSPQRQDMPQQEPDWEAPHPLTFAELMRAYRAFRQQRGFSEQVARKFNGAAVKLTGAVMPIDPPGEHGELSRFWLANPAVVMAGCSFRMDPWTAMREEATLSMRTNEIRFSVSDSL